MDGADRQAVSCAPFVRRPPCGGGAAHGTATVVVANTQGGGWGFQTGGKVPESFGPNAHARRCSRHSSPPTMAIQRHAKAATCALLLAATSDAFSTQRLLTRRQEVPARNGGLVVTMSYMDPPGQQPIGNPNNRGPSPGQPMESPRNAHLDRHAADYLDELRSKRAPTPSDPNQGRSFSANNPPGAFTVPNAGNTSGQSRRPEGRTGLGGLASGVRTPHDKYNAFDVRSERGGYRGGPAGGSNVPFGERRGYGEGRRGEPMRGELRGPMPELMPPPRGGGGGPDPREMDILQMRDEIERLRTENAMLKRSAKDLMNSFNELSNRLFDVDETLKKVANVFPSEGELESLEWLLKK